MTVLPNTTLREPAQRWRRGSLSRPWPPSPKLRSNLPSRVFASTNRYDRRRRGRVARAGFASRVRDGLRVVHQQLRAPGADLLAPSCRFCADLAPAHLCGCKAVNSEPGRAREVKAHGRAFECYSTSACTALAPRIALPPAVTLSKAALESAQPRFCRHKPM